MQDLIRRAFAAVGYEHTCHPKGELAEDAERIVDSIRRGIPVMLKGCVVDASDWVLITGYGEDGRTLFGSSTYGAGKDFQGYDAIQDWHAETREYIVLGSQCQRPAMQAIYTDALRLAVDLVRTPKVPDRSTGLTAYDALAAALRQEQFREDAECREDKLGFRYLCILCYNMMLDDHRSAAPFLNVAAKALPECSTQLLAAASCYENSVELRGELENIVKSDFSHEAQRRLLDPNVREEYARTLLMMRDAEAAGISSVEQALARIPEQSP